MSALVLAFAGLGDSFLYIVLPVHAIQMHVPLVWVGFLLSINRFARLISNSLFGYLFTRFGFKNLTILAAIFATLSTLSYAMATGILLWIIARITWGFCFSALQISAVSYSLDYERKGFALGLSRGLQETGPVLSLLIAPLLLKEFGVSHSFLILSSASAIAIIFSFFLPGLKQKLPKYNFSFNIIPSGFNLLSFLLAFFVQGILIVTITKLITQPGMSIVVITASAGLYLAYRRICSVFISPLGGLLADKFGMDKLYMAAVFFILTGFFLITVGYIKMGILTVFSFYTIVQSLSAGYAASGTENNIKAVALNNTWSDLGAASGALIAGSFLEWIHPGNLFIIAIFILLPASIIHIKTILIKQKLIVKWK